MPTTTKLLDKVAERFIELDTAGQPMAPVADIAPAVNAEEAYQIQRLVVGKLVERGDKIIGRKMGFLTPASQSSIGLAEPAYGHLLQNHLVAAGSPISMSTLIRPMLECEVAFRLGQNLSGPDVTVDDVLVATEAVFPAFELPDFRSQTLKPTLAEALGYNVFARIFVVGTTPIPVEGLDLPGVTVTLKRNGETVASAGTGAVMDNPAASVAWLANKMAAHDLSLAAGEVVMAGTLTPLQPVQAGDHFEAEFNTLGMISIRFE